MKVAIHVHVFYADLLEPLAAYLEHIPAPYDLIVTVTDGRTEEKVRSAFAALSPAAALIVIPVSNKGRDVKPFYTDIAPMLFDYDVVAHVHTKKSAFNNGATAGWFEFIMDAMMGSRATVEKILRLFAVNPYAGLVYPGTFDKLPYWANTWLSNQGWARRLQQRLRLAELPSGYFSYPVGHMFWARVDALRPLLQLGLLETDYPPESGQRDGEIMHALERMVSIAARAKGYNGYIVKKEGADITFTDDRDGIDLSGYYMHSTDHLQEAIASPQTRVVSFDIFDTLVQRCLTDPEDLFDLLQPIAEQLARRAVPFRLLRRDADTYLRSRLQPGQDVTLAAIYQWIGHVLRLGAEDTRTLMDLEVQLESRFTRPRAAVVRAMELAYELGRRVVLTSDTYLGKGALEPLLHGLGIKKYHRLYLSADVGKRKDNRTLFPYILREEGIAPGEMLHIGDNEHSDLQIPGDLGIRVFHVMRASALFRQTSLSRADFPGRAERLRLFQRISLGLCQCRLFDNPFPKGRSMVNGDLYTLGYVCFGPPLLAFVQWVAQTARKDGIERLYFLARDGDVLIRIYRLLQEFNNKEFSNLAPGILPATGAPLPEADYLEVSRRSVGVPFIESREQLEKLLRPQFPIGPLSRLIRVRLGFNLAALPGLDVRPFGFRGIHSPVSLPADMEKVKRLAAYLFEQYSGLIAQEKEQAIAYLEKMGLFRAGSKAVVDIGYSGTLQRILNDITGEEPVHGYYMVLYDVIDALLKGPHIRAKGLFGDRIDPYSKELLIDRYSLFFEMVLSSTTGPVVRYRPGADGTPVPEYAPVSPGECGKLQKLPLIHEGILDYCRDMLGLLPDTGLIACDDHSFLLAPFYHFIRNPQLQDLTMLAGYSLDDDYCGQGILYWAPPAGNPPLRTQDFLWKKYVPEAPLWYGGGGGDESAEARGNGATAALRAQELFDWYQQQYELLPDWYKKIGHVLKLLKGTKRLKLVLEDIGYVRAQPSKADEIQAWYNKEYEVLPHWYKRFGHFVKHAMPRRAERN